MIKLAITEGGIELNGHADCSINGKDLACAAVSALTINLANSLQQIANLKTKTTITSGLTYIIWDPEELAQNHDAAVLIDAWYMGMMDINEQYNCIDV